MKKIKNLFECYEEGRNKWATRQLSFTTAPFPMELNIFTATRKWDGTACLVQDGKLYARYDAKKGKQPPEGAIPCQEPDLITGHWPHWVEVKDQPQFKWHRETYLALKEPLPNGTYELIGEKINGNKEKIEGHVFKKHGDVVVDPFLLNYDWIMNFLIQNPTWEGLVIYKNNDPFRKIRRGDFKELQQ